MVIVTKFGEPITEAKSPTKLPTSGSLDPRTDWMSPWEIEHIGFLRGLGAGASNGFGEQLKSAMAMGAGWCVETVDFQEAVFVKITYTNTRTCRSASMYGCIIFRTSKGMCKAYINGQRYRTCNNVAQAASYLRGKSSALIGMTGTL